MGEILNQEDLENHCNDFEKTISGYGERIAVLNFEYVQDFHLSFIDKDSFEILIDRCEILYFNICKYQQRTKYKHILGFLSVSMLCNNSKKLNNGTRIEINNKTFEILNYVMLLSGLLLKLDDSELKVQRINYTLYLLLRVVDKNFDKYVDDVLTNLVFYFRAIIDVDPLKLSKKEFSNYAKHHKDRTIATCLVFNAQKNNQIEKSLNRYLDEYRVAVENLYYDEKVQVNRKKAQPSLEETEVSILSFIAPPLITEGFSDYSDARAKDDDDENEDIKKREYDFSQDESTRRVSSFVDHQVLRRYLDHVHEPTVSNVYYIDPPFLKVIYQVLHDELQNNKDIEKSAMAACFLMSLCTGMSAVVFQYIDYFFEIKKLKHSSGRDYYLWTVDADVNKKLEGEIAKKGNRQNKHSSWTFQIPAMWIDRIKKAQLSGYTNTDFNQYLKECFFGYCIGNLSVTHIASQLSFHLHRICEDDLQKNFLIGKQVSHQPDLAYGGFSYKQLNDSYEKYVWLWFQNKHESHVLDRPQFIQAKSDERVGSQRAWSFNQAKKFLNSLNNQVIEVLRDKKSIEERFNAFSVWIWICCLLSSGARPAIAASSIKENYDFITGIVYIHDKNSQSRPHGRFSPLTEFFANELKLYEKFIIDLMDSGMLTKSEDNYYLHYWKKNAGFMNIKISPLTQKDVASYLARNFPEIGPLYPNWIRHFVRNTLDLPDAVFKSWYAHDQQGEIGFSKSSSLQPYAYKTQIQDALSKLFKDLELISVGISL